MTDRTPAAEGARIAALLEPVVAAAGFDLEQVSVSAVGRRGVVRVVVDADDGVSLDDIAEVSRLVSGALDEADDSRSFGSGPYTLEVTSPGVARPLTQPRHWRRAAGRLVRVRVGDTGIEGRVVSADATGVVLDVRGTPRAVPYAELGKGAVQVEFARKGGASS
jgi:ribosome maturation factor RimP